MRAGVFLCGCPAGLFLSACAAGGVLYFFLILCNLFSGEKGTSSSEAGSLLPRTPLSFQHCGLDAVFCTWRVFLCISLREMSAFARGFVFFAVTLRGVYCVCTRACFLPACGWELSFLFLFSVIRFSGEGEKPVADLRSAHAVLRHSLKTASLLRGR